jgi:hypothetical protein
MNILLTYSGSGKILQSATFEDGVALANSLSLSFYNLGKFTNPLVVNDANGEGYSASLLNSGTQTNYLIFDSSATNALTWIANNHSGSTINAFGASPWKLHI